MGPNVLPEMQALIADLEKETSDSVIGSDMKKFCRLLKPFVSEYQRDQDFLANMNLGDFLNTLDFKAHKPSDPRIKEVRDSILKIILDGLDLSIRTSKLNEPDASGVPPLYTAALRKQVRRFGLLLANGADPDEHRSPVGLLYEVSSKVEERIMRELVDFRTFSKHYPKESILVTFIDFRIVGYDATANQFHESLTVEALQQGGSLWPSWLTNPAEQSTWIRLSSTNGLILLAIFISIQNEKSMKRKLQDYQLDIVKFFYDSFQLPSISPGDLFLNYREPSYLSRDYRGLQTKVKCTSIVFPCLALCTSEQQETRRKNYEKMRGTLLTKVSGTYESFCSVHLERTLDEAYYPGLSKEDLKIRNQDQVVSRYFKEKGSSDDIPILIVPQLWLWRIDNIVISAYSVTPQSSLFAFKASVPGEERSVEWEHRIQTASPDLQMGLIIASQVDNFGEPYSHQEPYLLFSPTLDIFETSVVSVLSDVDKYMEATAASSVNFKLERRFLHILSDARSELAMIKHILSQQKDILGRLLNDPNRDEAPTQTSTNGAVGWEKVEMALAKIEQYELRIEKIDGDADRIEKAVQDMLNLKRTYASVKDAHSSVVLSTAVIGFTVITVIFTPLAFLTALFALPMDGFARLQHKVGDQAVYKSDYMGGIFVSVEVLTIALTVLAVLLSLKVIKTWDKDQDEGNTKQAKRKSGSKKQRESKGSRARAGRADLESQQDREDKE